MSIDAFLKIEGQDVDGECTVEGHEKELQIQSYSLGAMNTGSRHMATGGGAGKGDMHDPSFTMYTDKSAPRLFVACLSGEHFDKATLVVRNAGGDQAVDFMKVEMKDIIISSYSSSGSNGSDRSMDSFGINAAEITVTYTPQEEAGTPGADVVHGWNIAQGKKV